MKAFPIKDRPDLARCEFRMQNWPAPPEDVTLSACRPIYEWVEANIAPHRVNVSGERYTRLLEEKVNLGEILERRYGAPMLRRNKENKYYWTAGTWMSIIADGNIRPLGRSYIFMDANAAFEFKMVYA